MAERNTNNRKFFKRRRPRSDAERARSKKRRSNRMKKGIFILPSLLTLTGIFLGFYGMVSAIKGQFLLAGALILVAGFFDGVDGKVARLTKTTTRFGLELDSLADVISFGVAPALLMYMWALEPYGRIGWVSAFVFVACGALRLARFNVQSGSIDPKVFNGLPIPAAAAVIASLVLFCGKLAIDPLDYGIPLLLLTYILAFFMVSSVKFHAFKDLTLVKQKPFSSTVAFVLLLALIAASPFVVPFLICAAYLVSGPILTAVLIAGRRKRAAERALEPEHAGEDLEPKHAAPGAD
jgi:CDP-diacylglycerol---serine O-phosphatidyltransferase